MQTQLTPLHTGLLVFVAMVALEIVKLTVRSFYAKTVSTEYVTVARCRQCREDCNQARHNTDNTLEESIDKLGRSIDVLRGIVLVLAVKVGVEESTLQDLASKKAS